MNSDDKTRARERALAVRLNQLDPLKIEMETFCAVGERFTYLGLEMLVTKIRVDMDEHLRGVPGNVICSCDYVNGAGSLMQCSFGYEMIGIMRKENIR